MIWYHRQLKLYLIIRNHLGNLFFFICEIVIFKFSEYLTFFGYKSNQIGVNCNQYQRSTNGQPTVYQRSTNGQSTVNQRLTLKRHSTYLYRCLCFDTPSLF